MELDRGAGGVTVKVLSATELFALMLCLQYVNFASVKKTLEKIIPSVLEKLIIPFQMIEKYR